MKLSIGSKTKIIITIALLALGGVIHYTWYNGMIAEMELDEKKEWKKRKAETEKIIEKQKVLAQKIREYAGSGRCSNSSECVTVGLGAKTCGKYGNFFYYSKNTVQLKPFLNAVDELNKNQEIIMRQSYKTSFCGVSTPKAVCIDQVCSPPSK